MSGKAKPANGSTWRLTFRCGVCDRRLFREIAVGKRLHVRNEHRVGGGVTHVHGLSILEKVEEIGVAKTGSES